MVNSSATVSIPLKEASLQKGQVLRLPPEFLIKRAVQSPIVRNFWNCMTLQDNVI